MTWHWNKVDQALSVLDQQNTDKDKHVRSDSGHTQLYVHDDKLHGIGSPKDKYAEGVRLIKDAIKLDYGDNKDDQVFRNIGITSDKDGLKLKQIPALRKEVSRLVLLDLDRFRFVKLPGLTKATQAGSILQLQPDIQKFYLLRTHDAYAINCSTDQSTWDYPGDKVHVSVHVPADKDDLTQLEAAWNNVVLPFALGDHETIREFKVANMEAARRSLPRADAQRIYFGAQITVYLRATPGDEKRAAERFAEVMKSVNYALSAGGISPGKQPDSDLKISDYLSFRHDLDDLLPDSKAEAAKQDYKGGTLEMYLADRRVSIDDSDLRRYGEHKKKMENRLLYRILKEIGIK